MRPGSEWHRQIALVETMKRALNPHLPPPGVLERPEGSYVFTDKWVKVKAVTEWGLWYDDAQHSTGLIRPIPPTNPNAPTQ